jgi:hypothetical protein
MKHIKIEIEIFVAPRQGAWHIGWRNPEAGPTSPNNQPVKLSKKERVRL